jgi:hypothetical protein
MLKFMFDTHICIFIPSTFQVGSALVEPFQRTVPLKLQNHAGE